MSASDPHATSNRVLTGDCEVDCVDGCAYPGRFSECSLEQEEPDCAYCRGTGLSPYSIRDVPCRHCGGQG